MQFSLSELTVSVLLMQANVVTSKLHSSGAKKVKRIEGKKSKRN